MSLADRVKNAAKILTLDIETSPNVGYHWGLWNQNIGINQIVEPGRVICWGAKWYGAKAVEFRSDHHDGHDTMVHRMWELLNEADITVGFNHKKFDLRHLHREFLLQGLTPPSPNKDVDLLLEVRKAFMFPSNKLDYVSQQVGIGQKVQHEGFSLWTSCLAGDEAAWKRMRKYCVGDVQLTEKLYDHLRPWIKNHPHMGVNASDEDITCNRCGSDDLRRDGTWQAQQILYARYQCNGCGGWIRGCRHARAAVARGI